MARRNELLHVEKLGIHGDIHQNNTNHIHRMNHVRKVAIFSSNGKFAGPALFWMAILDGLKNKQQERMSKKLADFRFLKLDSKDSNSTCFRVVMWNNLLVYLHLPHNHYLHSRLLLLRLLLLLLFLLLLLLLIIIIIIIMIIITIIVLDCPFSSSSSPSPITDHQYSSSTIYYKLPTINHHFISLQPKIKPTYNIRSCLIN